MQGLLVRVAVDSTAGEWNGPVDPETREFVYVPIPEQPERVRPGHERKYAECEPALRQMGLGLPSWLAPSRPMHLDPDFENLTYGDCTPRGNPIRSMQDGDFLVFYAGLRSVRPPENLVYAIIGFYEVAEVVTAEDVPECRWGENAHTRRLENRGDVIVRAKPGRSGRCTRCIPIGEYRNSSYRVTPALLERWGDISANDGFIQRSAVLQRFLHSDRFMEWFRGQDVVLVEDNSQ